MKKVAVIMGSDSDLPVVEKAINTLKEFGVPFEAHVYSAHRTPDEAAAFAAGAKQISAINTAQQATTKGTCFKMRSRIGHSPF